MKGNQREWVDRPRLKEAREGRGAPKAMGVGETLMVMETDWAMQDVDIYRGQQDLIPPSSKEMKKDVKNMYSLQVMEKKSSTVHKDNRGTLQAH